MIKENKSEIDILGISIWHELGYTGKGIKVANLEGTYPAWFLQNQLRETFEYNLSDKTNIHGQKTMDCISQAAPDAELYPLSNSTAKVLTDTFPFILDNNIHLVNASLTSTIDDDKNKAIERCVDNRTIFVAAAGNTGKDGMNKGYPSHHLVMSIGAVHYDEDSKKITKASYSTTGDKLFATCFSNLWLRDGKDRNKLIPSQQGTSFSSPLFVGMLALVQQFFLEKIGRVLYKNEIEEFIKNHVIDLGEIGHDKIYGHGLFVLPDPRDIDVTKYCNEIKESDTSIGYLKEEGEEMADIFNDDNGRWSEQFNNRLAELGIINGDGKGNIRPTENITREEAFKIAAVTYETIMDAVDKKLEVK